jgi:UDP-glucose 6-dehydrogenase
VSLRFFDYNEKARENFEKLSYSLSLSNRSFISLTLCHSFSELVENVDALIVTLEDPRIKEENIRQDALKDNVIFDGRNILDKEDLESR